MKLSCTACRQKKIRCDKESPCGNCQRTGSQCTPQIRAKAIRRSRKTDESLLQRLRQLEGIVSRLDNGQVHDLPASAAPEQRSPSTTSTTESSNLDPSSVSHVKNIARPKDDKLVNRNGQTTYRPEGFWATLTKQIAEQVTKVLDEEQHEDEESDDEATLKTSQSSGQVQFVLGFTTDAMTLRLLHPSPEHLTAIWATFMESCQPILKYIYVPYGLELINRAMTDLASLNHVEDAWLFSLYYMTTVTMKPDQCRERLGIHRDMALERFRWAAEQSLARAGFLMTQDLYLLEAFTNYCMALARHIESGTVRAMINLLVNVAHQMGLHRDGEQFGLPPYETEWRRKLWWTVRTIDLGSSLDYDAQSLLSGRWYDTKLPTNARDEDIWPDMLEAPKSRDEVTGITFSLLRWSLTDAMIEIGKISQMPDEQRFQMIGPMNSKLSELGKSIGKTYLRFMKGDDFENDPFGWIATRQARMLMCRLWLIVNQPLIDPAIRDNTNEELQEQAYRRACIVLIALEQIEKPMSSVPWCWMLKRMLDWHAIYIVISTLSQRQNDQDEMWDVIARAFKRWDGDVLDSSPNLQKPLQKIYNKALAERKRRLDLQQGVMLQPRTVDVSPVASSMKTISHATPLQQPEQPSMTLPTLINDDFRLDNLDAAEMQDFPYIQDFDFSDFSDLERFDMYQTAGTYNVPVPGFENWADANAGFGSASTTPQNGS